MTLLEKAKAIGHRSSTKHVITPEKIELAIAYIKNEITMTQIAKVLSDNKTSNTGNIMYFIPILLKEAYKQGLIKVNN